MTEPSLQPEGTFIADKQTTSSPTRALISQSGQCSGIRKKIINICKLGQKFMLVALLLTKFSSSDTNKNNKRKKTPQPNPKIPTTPFKHNPVTPRIVEF